MMKRNKAVVKVREREICADNPSVCVPLIGKDQGELLIEIHRVKNKLPDLIEWRADFFEDLVDKEKVKAVLQELRSQLGDIPILFTIRSEKEGGQAISLNEKEKIELIGEVCSSGNIDLIDYELFNNEQNIKFVRDISRENDVRLVLSYHNFEMTPSQSQIVEKCKEAEKNGADIAKVSVMAQNSQDVLLLLQATQSANEDLSIPLITISMGEYGSITRMVGFVFGSSITFGIAHNSSAPGQTPIEDVKEVIRILKKTI